MYQGLLVIDADAHKLENPLVRDYLSRSIDRIGLVVDLGDQRARIVDFNPATVKRLYADVPSTSGMGKVAGTRIQIRP